jgi:hypothetical protein
VVTFAIAVAIAQKIRHSVIVQKLNMRAVVDHHHHHHHHHHHNSNLCANLGTHLIPIPIAKLTVDTMISKECSAMEIHIAQQLVTNSDVLGVEMKRARTRTTRM